MTTAKTSRVLRLLSPGHVGNVEATSHVEKLPVVIYEALFFMFFLYCLDLMYSLQVAVVFCLFLSLGMSPQANHVTTVS